MNSYTGKAVGKFKQFLSIALTLAVTVALSGFAVIASTVAAHGQTLPDGALIKTADRPEVYIIKNSPHGGYLGWKRHIFNPEVFNMYGHLKWENIQIVSQSVLDKYHTSDLYRADGDPKVYVLEEQGNTAVKHWLTSPEALTSRGYVWDQIFIVNEKERDYYPTGEPYGPITNQNQNNNNNNGQSGPMVGSGLSVSLASDNPVSETILVDSDANQYPQALIPFLKLNFTAGTDGDVKVTQLKVKRTGIANDSDLGNVYLFEGNTKLAEYTSFNNKVVTFTNSNGLFTVPSGQTKTITVKADLARSNPSISASKTIGFEVVSASDITTDGATVSGTFPLMGNKMITAQVSDLGAIYFSNYTTYPSSVKGDDKNKELWRFNLTADSQDMEVRKIVLTMIGTINPSNIQNLKLEVAGSQVASAQSIGENNQVIFDLSSNPVRIDAGQTKTFVLKADLNGGAGRSFKFTVQNQTDVVAYDRNYGVFVPVAKDSTTGAFAIIQPTTGAGTSVDSGTLTLGIATDSPIGNIADGATGLTLAKFSFYAAGEDIKVSSLPVKCTSGDSSTKITNVKLMLEGSQVGTTVSSLTCDNSSTATYTFGNTFIVPRGTTKYLTVVADTTDSTVASGDTIAVTLAASSGTAQGQSTLNSVTMTDQTARTLTVQSGAATVSKNVAFGDKSSTNPTGTVNASNVKIASFVITAGAGEAIDVTQITLKDDSTTSLGSNFQNLRLKDSNGNQIGSTIASLNTTDGTPTTYSFTPANAIRINAGQQFVVDVYADIKSSVDDAGTVLSPVAVVDSITATGVNTSTDASYTTAVNLQAAYIATSGNLTVTVGADTPVAQQLVMGSTDVALATFKLEADAAEDIQVTDITVSSQIGNNATGTIKNLKLYVDGQQIGQTVQFSATSATSTYANATFSGLNLVIPRNSSKIITVRGDVTTYNEGAVSGGTHKFALLVNTGGGNESITAKGVSSGASITGAALDYGTSSDADQVANTMTVYATKISVAWASDTPSGTVLAGQAGQIVAKIVVSNTSNVGNYAATVKLMNFTVSSVGLNNATAVNLDVYKDSVTTANKVATTSWLANQALGNTAITDGNFTDVEVSAGSSRTFIVTMDTQRADSATDSISIGVAQGGVTWSDSKSASITSVDSLPLIPKTLSR